MTTPEEAAAILGRKGGASTSEAKQEASRENGKLGGRPRKSDDLKVGDKVHHYQYGTAKVISIQPKTLKQSWAKVTIKRGRFLARDVDSCDLRLVD